MHGILLGEKYPFCNNQLANYRMHPHKCLVREWTPNGPIVKCAARSGLLERGRTGTQCPFYKLYQKSKFFTKGYYYLHQKNVLFFFSVNAGNQLLIA